MIEHINRAEFQTICFDLGVDVAHLGSEKDNLRGKKMALIEYA
jgi:hypothetical protein